MGVLILALIAAAVTLVIVSRKERELEEEEDAEEESKRRASEDAARVFKSAPAAVAAAPAAAKKTPDPTPEPVPVIPAVEPAPGNETSEAAETESPADNDPETFVLDGWYCVKCGSFNRGHNCTACGAEKPKDAVQFVCDKCGWSNPDPDHPPRFCPDCGAPFAAADDE